MALKAIYRDRKSQSGFIFSLWWGLRYPTLTATHFVLKAKAGSDLELFICLGGLTDVSPTPVLYGTRDQIQGFAHARHGPTEPRLHP